MRYIVGTAGRERSRGLGSPVTDRISETVLGHRESGVIVPAKEEPSPWVHGTPGCRWGLARLGPAVRETGPRAESFVESLAVGDLGRVGSRAADMSDRYDD